MPLLFNIDWQKFAVIFAAWLVLDVLLIWLVSAVINRKKATIQNALAFFFLRIALVFACIIALVGGVLLIRLQHLSLPLLALWALLCLLGVFVGYFKLLMDIYDVGFPMAFVFAVMLAICGGGTGFVVRNALGIKPMTAQSAAAFQDSIKKMLEEQKVLPSPSPAPEVPVTASTPTPASSIAPAMPRPVPKDVVLLAPVQISAIINGQPSGQVTLPRGMWVKLIAVHGDMLTIETMGAETTIPKKSTDFPVDAH